MTGFALDTSGAVLAIGCESGAHCGYWHWSDLDPFTQGYVEALFGSPIYDGIGTDRYFPSLGWSFSDLAPVTLAAILKDCAAFVAGKTDGNWLGDLGWKTPERGADFWGSRQGSVWIKFPPLTTYLDDAGKVRLREAGQ